MWSPSKHCIISVHDANWVNNLVADLIKLLTDFGLRILELLSQLTENWKLNLPDGRPRICTRFLNRFLIKLLKESCFKNIISTGYKIKYLLLGGWIVWVVDNNS